MRRNGKDRARVLVKICGITNWADARRAVEAGADALGFNFYPPSPRYVSPAQARRITDRLPKRVLAVGVFVNEPPARVRAIARAAGLDWVQLHGAEQPREVGQLAKFYDVIKAFRVRPGFRPVRLARYRRAAAFLLDGFRSGLYGGTGRRFDWRIARRAKRYGRIVLAGGLAPENVAEAIACVRPFAIDVSSGVEAKPGKKDPARLRDLMRQVEKARRELLEP
jgi:phosphoribosylanthranilate isomerase